MSRKYTGLDVADFISRGGKFEFGGRPIIPKSDGSWALQDPADIPVEFYGDAQLAAIRAQAPTTEAQPDLLEWREAAMKVQSSVMSYHQRLCDETGLGILVKGSPGTGKTRAMLELAAKFLANNIQVLWMSPTTELAEETATRAMYATGIRPLIVPGRREDNCDEFRSVERAQEYGYSPAKTVCAACPFHPEAAANQPCRYYGAQMRASNTIRRLQRIKEKLPLVICTYESAVSHADPISHGKWGEHWKAPIWMFDEDPSRALRDTFSITNQHLKAVTAGLSKILHDFMLLLRHVQSIVHVEGPETQLLGQEQPTVYAGIELHDILQRACTAAFSDVVLENLLAATAEHVVALEDGGLLEADDETLSRVPHGRLGALANSLLSESHALQSMPEGCTYGVRLEERREGWVFIHDTLGRLIHPDTNVIVGDAYADKHMVDRYFKRNFEMVDVEARLPKNVRITRSLTTTSKRRLSVPELMQDLLETELRLVLSNERDRKVLVYTNKSLRESIEKWLLAHQEEFGLEAVEVEHYWSGRGKDVYRYHDTVILLGEPIPNPIGLVHESNALHPLEPAIAVGDGHDYHRSDQRLHRLFRSRASQEIAQAVHRIRPAIPVDTDKRIFLFGEYVELPEELTRTLTLIYGDTDQDSQLQEGRLELGSHEEVCDRIMLFFERFGCWSRPFAWTLLYDFWENLEDETPLDDEFDLFPVPSPSWQQQARRVYKSRAFRDGERAALDALEDRANKSTTRVRWSKREIPVWGDQVTAGVLLDRLTRSLYVSDVVSRVPGQEG